MEQSHFHRLNIHRILSLAANGLLWRSAPGSLSDRATKYGILFVALTFGGFFLVEMLKELPIHPIQYLLVGFELAVFFLLLISFSEHMGFALAYLIASLASIAYVLSFLRSSQHGPRHRFW